MKKDTLFTGLAFLLLGISFFAASIYTQNEVLVSRFAGFGGGFTVPSLIMIYKYFHWSKPENSQAYNDILKQEQIMLKDERSVMLRSHTCLYMYRLTLILLALILFVCSLLSMDIWILVILTALLIFEIIGYILIYKRLNNKL